MDNYVFNYTQILSVFLIKAENSGKFSPNDVYGVVLAYYDDIEEEPDRRYLNFLKGDLITKDANI